MKKTPFQNIVTGILFIGIIASASLFNISCKNNSINDNNAIDKTRSNKSDKFTILEIIPSDESLPYNVEILQDRRLLEKLEGKKGKFEHKAIIELGHRVILNAVYQEDCNEEITIRISKNGKLLRETSAKRGVFGMAYIIN